MQLVGWMHAVRSVFILEVYFDSFVLLSPLGFSFPLFDKNKTQQMDRLNY